MMKEMECLYYRYEELLEKATGDQATQEDIDLLGKWFELFGSRYWNGEFYDADGQRLAPIIVVDEETDIGEIVRYEFI